MTKGWERRYSCHRIPPRDEAATRNKIPFGTANSAITPALRGPNVAVLVRQQRSVKWRKHWPGLREGWGFCMSCGRDARVAINPNRPLRCPPQSSLDAEYCAGHARLRHVALPVR